jgi:hypothetical protein
MYGGMLPSTGGFLNPLRVLYVLIAAAVFGGGWFVRRVLKEVEIRDEG